MLAAAVEAGKRLGGLRRVQMELKNNFNVNRAKKSILHDFFVEKMREI